MKPKRAGGRRRRKSGVAIRVKKKQRGGALRRRHGPSLQDKIAYGASMILAGPAPTFFTLGGKLAGQAIKGISDNVHFYLKRR